MNIRNLRKLFDIKTNAFSGETADMNSTDSVIFFKTDENFIMFDEEETDKPVYKITNETHNGDRTKKILGFTNPYNINTQFDLKIDTEPNTDPLRTGAAYLKIGDNLYNFDVILMASSNNDINITIGIIGTDIITEEDLINTDGKDLPISKLVYIFTNSTNMALSVEEELEEGTLANYAFIVDYEGDKPLNNFIYLNSIFTWIHSTEKSIIDIRGISFLDRKPVSIEINLDSIIDR